MVYTHDSKSCGASLEGSSPSSGTVKKLIVILGPTSSGKSDLAVDIAKKYSGEVISADSRQVYRGLDIGSGKITKKEMQGIPHHLLDVASPKRVFEVTAYQKKANKALADIWSRDNIPVLCGGTGFYIQAVVDGTVFPKVPPNKKLRAELESMPLQELQKKLQKLDPRRYKEIDIQNPRRLVRAIEIATSLGKVPEPKQININFDLLIIGIETDTEKLYERIHHRLITRLKQGMVAEVRKLHEQGVSWKRMESLGLEYRYLARFLQKKINKTEMVEQLETEIRRYAKRQKTWFKRDNRIKWFKLKDKKKIEKEVREFLK